MTGGSVDADHRSVQSDRVAWRLQVLGAQAASLRGGRGHRATDTARWVATGIHRRAELAVVGRHLCAVAAARIQTAIRAELQRTHRVSRELIAPVVDENPFRLQPIPADRQPRQSATGHAAIDIRARGSRAGVLQHAWCTPRRRCPADRRVVAVEHIQIRLRRITGIDRHPQQAMISRAVDLGAQVGNHPRLAAERLVEQDPSALFGHVGAAVGQKPYDRGLRRSTQNDRVGEPTRQDRALGARHGHDATNTPTITTTRPTPLITATSTTMSEPHHPTTPRLPELLEPQSTTSHAQFSNLDRSYPRQSLRSADQADGAATRSASGLPTLLGSPARPRIARRLLIGGERPAAAGLKLACPRAGAGSANPCVVLAPKSTRSCRR